MSKRGFKGNVPVERVAVLILYLTCRIQVQYLSLAVVVVDSRIFLPNLFKACFRFQDSMDSEISNANTQIKRVEAEKKSFG